LADGKEFDPGKAANPITERVGYGRQQVRWNPNIAPPVTANPMLASRLNALLFGCRPARSEVTYDASKINSYQSIREKQK
jgi:hypothetical protein